MSTLAEIQAQIEALQEQANLIKTREKDGVISEIREKIRSYGLTAWDLGLTYGDTLAPKRSARGSKSQSKREPKYRDDNGNEWSGGRGRRPQWILALLADGEDIEKYRIAE